MKKPAVIDIISSPFFLAGIFSIPFIIYFEISQKKHTSKIINTQLEADGANYYFNDLDMDSRVELIRSKKNIFGEVAFVVEKDGKILDQFNLEKGVFFNRRIPLFFGDYNNDSLKEIFCVTRLGNEIWLHVSDVFDTVSFRKHTIKVDTVGEDNGKYDLSGTISQLVDMNMDGIKDLVFSMNAGFSIYPRRVYYYDIANDSLHKSVPYGANGSVTQIADIDNDSIPEILLTTKAVSNMNADDKLILSDAYSWFLIFDNTLHFKIEPFQMGGKHTQVRLFFGNFDQQPRLISIVDKTGNTISALADTLTISMYKNKGKFDFQKDMVLNSGEYRFFKKNETNQLLLLEGNQMFCFDTLLNKKLIRRNLPGSLVFRKSIAAGRDTWYLFSDMNTTRFYIADKNFSRFINTNIVDKKAGYLGCFLINMVNGNPTFAIQSGNEITTFMIVKNPHYQFRFGYYTGGYLIIYLIVWLIQYLQRRQMEKKQALEKEINRLQFATLKNQLEPHFTMNVLNAIAGFVLKNSPDAAYDYIVSFSRMINATLRQSDDLQRSLHDEIDFVKDYMELQKLRYRNKLNYEIKIGEEIPSSLKIPKMLIQSHVENAIKHGLKSRDGAGTIKIQISKPRESYIVSISDDGIGRKAASKLGTDGTGKGLETMKKYYALFKSLTGKTISHEVKDLTDDNGESAGTEVIVKISTETTISKVSLKGR